MTTKYNIDKSAFAYQLRGTFRAYETALGRYLHSQDLPLSHYYVLCIEWPDVGITQRNISENAFMTESVLSQVLKKMMAKEMLVRTDASDNYAGRRLVSLTPKGKAFRKKILQDVADLIEKSYEGLPEEKIEDAVSILVNVRENVETMISA